ncbi:hypothetical protein LTR85_008408 [Meristemomyces frigidus]|nr:hypothetical protein LTR85_008408 [Meristemomyces frigidus]
MASEGRNDDGRRVLTEFEWECWQHDLLTAQQEGLQTVQDELKRCIDMRTLDSQTLNSISERLEPHVTRLRTHIVQHFHVDSQLPTKSSVAKAQQVFDTPELLEHILLRLSPRDAFRAQQASRRVHDLIMTSPCLQRHLYLKADPQADFSTAFSASVSRQWDSSTLLKCTIDRSKYIWPIDSPYDPVDRPDVECNFTVWFECLGVSPVALPKLGERCRSMLVYYRLHDSVGVPKLVRSSTGITVGDIHDATKELMDAHCLCPHAGQSEHAENGEVKVKPAFTAVVSLKNKDPLVVACLAKEREECIAVGRKTDWQARMTQYMQAKHSAFSAGQRIPSLAGFEESRQASSTEGV